MKIFLQHSVRRFSLGFLCLVSFFPGTLLAGTSWDGKAPVEYVLSVTTDRPDAIYHQGEPVTFNILLEDNKQPATAGEVTWTISKDSVPPIETGSATLAEGKAAVTGSLTEPGFLRCEVTFKHDKDKFTAVGAAAIDPLEIKPSLPAPDDFDAFWAEKKKELAAVPINAKLTPVPLPPNRTGVELFEYQADSIGAPSVGYYGRPAGAKPKSLPAVLFVPGAGVRSANLDAAAGWSKSGMLFIDLNAHGIPDGKPKEFYAALDSGELKDYRTRGRESRDTYYFLGVYFRVLRALDFLTSQPEWDGKTLILSGVSQGGGLALAGAALDPRVTYMIAFVPGLSDHTGMLVNRIAGWPKLIPKGPDGKPDPKVMEVARYFDNVNFASRVKVPGHFAVGFLDTTCPPTCTYAVYNNFAGKKDIVNYPNNGHDLGFQIWNDMRKVILAVIAGGPEAKATTVAP